MRVILAVAATALRTQGENLTHNLEKAAWLQAFAAQKNASANQVALAWLLSQGDDIIPIVSMSKPQQVAESLQDLKIEFTAAEMSRLNEAFAPGAIQGKRYPTALIGWVAS